MKGQRRTLKTAAAPRAATVRNYDQRTIKLLWGRAGGRCAMPDCRIDLIADATDYDPAWVIGEMAHVAGASDEGPRPKPQLTTAERNHYKNLILLCRNCHGKIDGQPGFHSEAMLLDIKEAHEAWVRASLPERGRSKSGWLALALEGDHPVDLATADQAISPDFIVGDPHRLQVPTRTEDWGTVDARIASEVAAILAQGDAFERRIAVFPLAPVSACLSLGFHLTSRPNVKHFQLHRDDRNWTWPRRQVPAQDIEITSSDADREAEEVAFFFHLSATIWDEAVDDVLKPRVPRVHIRIPEPTTAWLVHPHQVIWMAATARQAFEQAVAAFPKARRWHIFYAGPAPVGVAVGQSLNPTMYPPVQLYEYQHRETPPYRPSIILGG